MENNNTAAASTGVHNRTQSLVLLSLFTALILIMAFVPNLGYINLILIKATLIHIPVIIGSIFLGPKKGAFLGGVFGATSFINNTINPSVMSFAFSPVVSFGMFGVSGIFRTLFTCFVSRIMIGVVAYYIYKGVRKAIKAKTSRPIALAVAGVTGALTNTILVMGGIAVLYSAAYAEAKQMSQAAVFNTILGVVFGQGLMEAIVSGVIVTAVGSAIMAATHSDTRA